MFSMSSRYDIVNILVSQWQLVPKSSSIGRLDFGTLQQLSAISGKIRLVWGPAMIEFDLKTYRVRMRL